MSGFEWPLSWERGVADEDGRRAIRYLANRIDKAGVVGYEDACGMLAVVVEALCRKDSDG